MMAAMPLGWAFLSSLALARELGQAGALSPRQVLQGLVSTLSLPGLQRGAAGSGAGVPLRVL